MKAALPALCRHGTLECVPLPVHQHRSLMKNQNKTFVFYSFANSLTCATTLRPRADNA